MIIIDTKRRSTQETFDHVCGHLIEQNESATDTSQGDNPCKYRWQGLACAAGCLIADEHYSDEIEGDSVATYVAAKGVDLALIKSGLAKSDLRLVKELQTVHDYSNPPEWPGELRGIARRFKLDEPACIQ